MLPMISANRTVAYVAFAVGLFAPQLGADTVSVNWIGPTGMGGDGNWSTASDWSTGIVPNNGGGTTYAVTITGSPGGFPPPPFSNVLVDINPTIDSVNLIDSSLTIGGTLTTGTLSGLRPALQGQELSLNVNGRLNAGDVSIHGNGSSMMVSGTANISGGLGLGICGSCPFFAVAPGALVNAGSFFGPGIGTDVGGTLNVGSTADLVMGGTLFVGGTMTVGTGNLLPLSSQNTFVNGGQASAQRATLEIGNGVVPPPPQLLPNLLMGSNGTYDEVISGPSNFGQFTAGVQGVSLDGTLAITLANSYIPALGQTFPIITDPHEPADVIRGTFANIEGQTFNNGTEMWEVVYAPFGQPEVDLVAVAVPEPSFFVLVGFGLLGMVYARKRYRSCARP